MQVIEKNNSDYISLTYMTSGFREGGDLIGKWISNKNTPEYIKIWEKIHNPKFSYPEFKVIEIESGSINYLCLLGNSCLIFLNHLIFLYYCMK